MSDSENRKPSEGLADETPAGEELTDGYLAGIAGGERPAPKGDVWIPIHKAGG